MEKFAKKKKTEVLELYNIAAGNLGLNNAIIEKDFWVCYLLDILFNKTPFKNDIAFKGGTSISKSYNLIKRFSEDIDIILNWEKIGYKLNEPWVNRSNTSQSNFNKETAIKTEKYIKDVFMPILSDVVKNELGYNPKFYIDQQNPQTIIFEYNKIFKDNYILPQIRLEIGTLGAWTPADIRKIKPYIAEEFEMLFEKPTTNVLTIKPERTFWEKATILHRESNRKNNNFPTRYSRHYYDLYVLANSIYKENAIKNKKLLKEVVEFKDKFYHCPWAKYDECLNKKFKLIPNNEILEVISKDYDNMKKMIFKDIPSFDEIIVGLKKLEEEINSF